MNILTHAPEELSLVADMEKKQLHLGDVRANRDSAHGNSLEGPGRQNRVQA